MTVTVSSGILDEDEAIANDIYQELEMKQSDSITSNKSIISKADTTSSASSVANNKKRKRNETGTLYNPIYNNIILFCLLTFL